MNITHTFDILWLLNAILDLTYMYAYFIVCVIKEWNGNCLHMTPSVAIFFIQSLIQASVTQMMK